MIDLINTRFNTDLKLSFFQVCYATMDRYTLGEDTRKAREIVRNRRAVYSHPQNGMCLYDQKEWEKIALQYRTSCAFCGELYDQYKHQMHENGSFIAGWIASISGKAFCSALCAREYDYELDRKYANQQRQITWLRKGQAKLTAIRKLLKNPSEIHRGA